VGYVERENNLNKYSLLLTNEPDHEGKPNSLKVPFPKSNFSIKKVKDMKEKWAYT